MINPLRRLLRTCLLLVLVAQPASAAAFDWLQNILESLLGGSPSNQLADSSEAGVVVEDSNSDVVSIASTDALAEALYINCGSTSEETDSTGQIWQADQYFTNGGNGGGTWFWWLKPDGNIFQTYRNGFLRSPVRYEIPVADTADQEYSVALYFTEQFDFWRWLFGETSKMNVYLQGVKEFDQLEIIPDGTAPNVMRVQKQVKTTTGRLSIEIRSTNADPTLSAIEILQIVEDVVATTAPPTQGTTPPPTESPTDSSATTSLPTATPTRQPSAAPSAIRMLTLSPTSNPTAARAPISAPTAAPTATRMPTSVAPSPSEEPTKPITDGVRINCGGFNFTDKEGNVWEEDVYFTGGDTYDDARFSIAGSKDSDILYQTERNAPDWYESLFYEIPVANEGIYKVVLYNTELYFGEAGSRVFDVSLEDVVVEEGMDIFLASGAKFTADIQTYFVEVTDGVLNIEFKSVVDRAKIAAIEVVYEGLTRSPTATPTTSAPTTSPQPTEMPTVEPEGPKVFQEVDGLLIMEAESVPVQEPWKLENTVEDHTGTGYFRFDGNTPQGAGPLGYTSYSFNIQNAGTYNMMLRSYKTNPDNTLSNDCFTRLVGYPSFLDNSVKTYMAGPPFEWSFNTELDWHEQKMIPRYEFEADTDYVFQLAGRSKDFFVDRIVFFQESLLSRDEASNTTLPESPEFDPSNSPTDANGGGWVQVDPDADLIARHEACFVFDADTRKAYLLGGRYRGNNAVNIYNPVNRTWSEGAAPPIELHHTQCVMVNGTIWMVSAWTGEYPTESNVEEIHIYDPSSNSWSTKPGLPAERRRGGAAVVYYDRKIFVSHGNRGGHETADFAETLGWLDYFDIDSDEWVTDLLDAPNPRDHTGGVEIDGRICVAGGRDGGDIDFNNKQILPTDCYDPSTGTWTVEADIPVGRSGASYGKTCDGKLMIAGGEGNGQAYRNVDVFDGSSWTKLDNLNVARHGSGLAVDCQCNQIHIASGSGAQGGSPELRSVETYFQGGEDVACEA